MTNRPVLWVLVLTLGCPLGCYSVRPSLQANGEPLSATGWNAHKEAEVADDGTIIPEHDVFIFDTLSQGKDEIDELDYYNIAGDEDAVATLIDWRTKTNNANMVTYAGLGVGGASILSGFVVYGVQGGSFDPNTFLSNIPKAGPVVMGLVLGGAVAVAVGALGGTFFGPDEHKEGLKTRFGYDRAKKAADEYNARLGQPAESAPEAATP